MIETEHITARAKQALWHRFREVSAHAVDAKGYVCEPKQNLIDGVDFEAIREDFAAGSGNELDGKFLAVHSSSALAANSFGVFKDSPHAEVLSLAGRGGFCPPTFERQVRTGLGGTPPNLDVFFERATAVVGIESKCLEHLSRKTAKFADSYNSREKLAAEDSWWSLLQELKGNAGNRSYLDSAQLIKHYLGLRKQYAGRKSIVLMYVFWEPLNWKVFAEFREHRAAIRKFADRVAGSEVSFCWQSYPDLWAQWADIPALSAHVQRLRVRYGVAI